MKQVTYNHYCFYKKYNSKTHDWSDCVMILY